MKKILFLITVMLMSCPSAFAFTFLSDTLLREIKPEKAQRGVKMKSWQVSEQYINIGQIKYQVATDTISHDVFAIVNQVDTALKGKVNIPQFIHSEEYGNLEVRGLGFYAFYLSKVENVKLPESVEYIGDCAFFRCYRLYKLNIPEKVHTIGDCALAYTAIDSIRIPDNVVDLGALAVCSTIDPTHQFSGLKYLYLGKNVGDFRLHPNWGRSFDVNGFNYYNYSDFSDFFLNLEQIDVSPENEMYYSIDGVLYEKSSHKLCIYPYSKKNPIYVMPEDVTGLWKDMTRYAGLSGKYLQIVELSPKTDSLDCWLIGRWGHKENLRKVILPASLRFVDFCCRTDSLKSVYVKSASPCEIQFDVYNGTVQKVEGGDIILYVPRGCAGTYRSHSEWGRFKQIMEYDTIDYSVDYTSVIEPKADEAKVVVEGNNVSITTADHQSVAYIYDICGRLVASGRERTFSINQKGVFVLRFNSLSKKFIIR